MSTYTGKPVTVAHSAEQLFDKISNLNAFQERLEQLPEEAKAKLGDVRFTDDEIIINAPAVGELRFKIVEKIRPELVKLTAENSPVPFYISMKLKPESEERTEMSTELDVEIPAMLRPLVGSKMQEAADKFSEMFQNFFGA